MVIREMSREECLRVLSRSRLVRLACAQENQPYVVPVYLSYHEASGCLYGFTTPGQKVAWMRANPLVCVEVDEVAASDQWVSVIALGRYEELPGFAGTDDARIQVQERPRQVAESTTFWSADCHPPQGESEQELAWRVLQNLPEWWEPGAAAWAARAEGDPDEPYVSVYYRIRIASLTGHEATPDARDAI